jgi:phosphate transport system substrate-binding protein
MQPERSRPTVLAILTATAVLAAAFMAPAGCSRNKNSKSVKVVGSTSIQPFAEMLAEGFNDGQKEVYVEVQGGGTTTGLQAVEDGTANIGMCSRALKPEEKYTPITIAWDGVAVVVHNTNPVKNLSRQQIADMFTRKITNWKDVGGRDMPVRLITREEGSGTREAFTKLVMEAQFEKDLKKLKSPYKDPTTMPADVREQIETMESHRPRITMYSITEPSNGSVKALIEGDPGAIGYMSLGQVGKEVKALSIEGIPASAATVLEKDPKKKYPLVRPFLFVVRGELTPDAKKYVDFVLAKESQDLLEKKGLVRATTPAEATSNVAK